MLKRYLNLLQEKNVILVSGSKPRQELLSTLGIQFTAEASNFAEDLEDKSDPLNYVKQTCKEKLLTFVKSNPEKEVDLLIAADTIIFDVQSKTVLEKTDSVEQVTSWMKGYSDSYVVCYSAFCIAFLEKTTEGVAIKDLIEGEDSTEIHFCELTDEIIEDYLKENNWQNKAGAIAIQGDTKTLIHKIVGDYYNCVGLPLFKLNKALIEGIKKHFV